MKILAINASLRGSRGYTHFLIERLFEGARAAGADCETVTLADLDMRRCLSCDRCHAGGSLNPCVLAGKDDTEGVFARMAAADLIIYATPIYVFNLSSLLKTLLERFFGTSDVRDLRLTKSGLMFHHVDAAVCSKPFVTLITCDNMEDDTPRSVLTYFRVFSRFMDAPLVGELVRSGGSLAGYGDPAVTEKSPRLQQIYAAYHQAGRDLAQRGHISRATQNRANQSLIPVPFFNLLKRLPFRGLKERFLAEAKKWKLADL